MANDSNNNFIQPAIPRFDGHFDHWSMLMENFLRSKELWILVETGYTEPEEGAGVTETQRKKLEELKLKDLKVKNYLFQAIDRTILETILEKNTFKQIWDSMKRKYEGNARVKRSILQTLMSHVSDVATIVHPQNINVNLMGDGGIYIWSMWGDKEFVVS